MNEGLGELRVSKTLFYFTGNCVTFPVKQKALRGIRTAAEQNLSLRDPPQAENPAEQDSIFKQKNYSSTSSTTPFLYSAASNT